MRLLLDTQTWLWMLASPERLSKNTRRLVADAGTELLLSAASAWEIAIKQGIGKLQLPEPAGEYIPRLMAETRVTPLAIYHRHALHVATLPGHHRDPFDRLLVAQAQIERLAIVTGDRVFARYDVRVIAAD